MSELLSIIVPVYNVEKTLERCVDSILGSTYENIEIILVDDGTKDSSGTICDNYQRSFPDKIRVVHKKNGGLSSARNAGLAVAKGSLIGFVDSDDTVTPDMYQYLYTLLISRDADISACSFARHEAELDLNSDSEKLTEFNGEEEIMNLFFRVNGGVSFFSVCNRLYRRKTIENVFFLEGYINEDELFTYEVYKKCSKIVISNLKKYYYYMNETGITRNGLNNKDKNLLAIWDLIVKREANSKYESYARFNRARAAFTLCSKALLFGKSEDLDTDFYKQIKQEVKDNFGLLLKSKSLSISRKILLLFVRLF